MVLIGLHLPHRRGAKIDLVSEYNDGSTRTIEIKRALSARVERGFHLACADIKPARAFVVHAGDDRYPVSETIELGCWNTTPASTACHIARTG